jgi:hypothetical protein
MRQTTTSKRPTWLRKFILVGTWTNVQNILLSLKGIEKPQCDGYRRKNESAAWGRSIQKFIEQELTEFYTLIVPFKLFPNFIVQFELLLIDTELTERKDGELLNTELRIVALIV